MLCEKLGVNNADFRNQFKKIMKTSVQRYDPAKIIYFLIDSLENSKNKRTKYECMELMKILMATHDIIKYISPKDTKILLKYVNCSEYDLRASSLDILTEIYNYRGDSIWGLIGKVTEKTKAILLQKFNIDESMHKESSSRNITADLSVLMKKKKKKIIMMKS